MTISIFKRAVALGLAGAIALGAFAPASAAPVFTANARLTSDLPAQTTEIRWRRGGGIAAGVAAGLILGGIAAAGARPYYYGYGPGYYPGAYYGPGYPVYAEPEPVYVAPPPVYAPPPPAAYGEPSPAYGPRQCFVVRNADQGTGYWRPC